MLDRSSMDIRHRVHTIWKVSIHDMCDPISNIDWQNNRTVALVRERSAYPQIPPFHPSEQMPEWEGFGCGSEDNSAYRAVRMAFHELGFDRGNYGSPSWNPLHKIVLPGNVVIIKPNFVSHRNTGDKFGLIDTQGLVTHGSIIRVVVDYVAKALQGSGKIIVGDC